jgi:hypothetical protein
MYYLHGNVITNEIRQNGHSNKFHSATLIHIALKLLSKETFNLQLVKTVML